MTGFIVPALWSMIAGACLATGAIHLGPALKPPRQRARLAFVGLVASVAVLAVLQPMISNAPDPEQYDALRRWSQVPIFLSVVLIVVFVRSYLGTARAWLANLACGAAFASVVVAFAVQPEELSVVRWTALEEITLALLAAFVADAGIACWRRGDGAERRRALLASGSILLALAIVALDLVVIRSGSLYATYLYALASATVLGALGTERGARWNDPQHDRFRLVLEAASNGLIIIDKGGRVGLANSRAARTFEYSIAELSTLSVEDLIPAVSQGGTRGAVLLGLAGREVVGRRKSGTEFPLEINVTAMESSDGLTTLLSVVDMTERRRSEDLLRRERGFLRQVIDMDTNYIFVKDRDGRYTLANKAVADVYGTTVEDLIGRTDADFDPNLAEVKGFQRDDLQVMDTKSELFIAEERITDAAGKVHALQTIKRPLIGPDGKADHVLGVSTDITARKEAERELGVQRNEIAHLSRAMMVAELSGSLAHELNQPLTAILSNAQAALRFIERGDATPSDIQEILRDIVEDDKRAGHVIQGMRMLLTKGEAERAPMDLNAALQDVLRLMHSDLIGAGVTIVVRTGRDLAQVRADRVQIQQVLMNLMLNACDAMQQLAQRDRQLVIVTAQDGDFVRADVMDRGHGIAPENAAKIFEPFFTTKGHGLGMGLSICRTIVSAHGGKLWAEDAEGGGAVFRFTLPAAAREGR
jgi:two-component system sensor kinase FixL